jgi:hypothetical protein
LVADGVRAFADECDLQIGPTTERKSEIGDSIEVDTREKTDAKKSKTVAVVRTLKDQRLCPVYHYYVLKNGTKNSG